MRVLSLAILLTCIMLTSCSAKESNTNDFMIFNQNLLMAYENYDQELMAERSELMFSNKQVVKNCAMYFKLFNQYRVDEGVNNMIRKSEYLICDALKILSSSSSVSIVIEHNLGEKLSSKLDLRSFPSSISRQIDDQKHTLVSLEPNNITDKKFSTVLETADRAFSLEVVAIANINNNDSPDWIVWVLDEFKFGNYRAYNTLILYDVDNKNKYIAIDYPKY